RAAQQLEVALVGLVREPARQPVVGCRTVDARDEVDAQHGLTRAQLGDERVVVEVGLGVRPEPVQGCRHPLLWIACTGSRQPRIASVMRTASTLARTSCMRTMRAPSRMQNTIAASEPSSRW